jgi:hypothetical protein
VTCRTIMLRRTSKRDAAIMQIMMRQLTLMTVWCRISTLHLPCRYDDINRQDEEVLQTCWCSAQC